VLGVIANGPEELWVGFQYSSDLFDEGTILAMADTYTAVLAAACAAPDSPLSQLPLVTGPARTRLLHELQGQVSLHHAASSMISVSGNQQHEQKLVRHVPPTDQPSVMSNQDSCFYKQFTN
jgi:non-ribosomal peptide synthetase component F